MFFLKAGTFDMSILSQNYFSSVEQYWLWITFFLAFGAKIPIFPFHIWLPEAHVEASTVGSVFLAGILLKLGTYGLCRFNLMLFPVANIYFLPVVFTLCGLGTLFGSLSALRQTDFKRIIAYSSVAHMNFIVIGLFSLNEISLEGALFQSISHGFVTSALFFLIGMIYRRYHARSLLYYSGMTHMMPIYCSLFFLCTLANMAFPLTSSFIGEFFLLLGIFKLNFHVAIIVSLSIVLCGSYSLWLYNRICFGNINTFFVLKYSDIEYQEFLTVFPLVLLIIINGLFPNSILELLHYFSVKFLINNFFIF